MELRVINCSLVIGPVIIIASVNRMRPLGFSTRNHSFKASVRSGIWHMASFENTASNDVVSEWKPLRLRRPRLKTERELPARI